MSTKQLDDIMVKFFGKLLFVFGLILVIDQLPLILFGSPTGLLFPDLSHLDPTGNPQIHHWMLGVVMMIFGLWYEGRILKIIGR